MEVIEAISVNDALAYGIAYLLCDGIEESSRNGPVLVAPGPVCTVYQHPRERVIHSATRDANSFFHAMEAIWMLAGDNDIAFPTFFNGTYGQFSDDGQIMWDAYGWRWRKFFGMDQLDLIVDELKNNPASRRCVLAMWNAKPLECDLPHFEGSCPYDLYDHDDFYVATHGGKAVPCNTHAYFDCRGSVLNMTVCNRSNDIIFGCYGANVVHFSLLQEYMAARVGVPIGKYYQFSNNFHAYTNVFSREKLLTIAEESTNAGAVSLALGPSIGPQFDGDLPIFMAWSRQCIYSSGTGSDTIDNAPPLRDAFLGTVALPMFKAWYYRKNKRLDATHRALSAIAAEDWQLACKEWVERRELKVSK